MVTRRQALRRAAGLAVAFSGLSIADACAPTSTAGPSPSIAAATPTPAPTLPPPETTSISITASACDSAIFGAERYLREEGFTEVKITDKGALPEIAAGNAQLGNAFVQAFFNAVESGPKVVSLGGLHPGCAEIWAQQNISSVKDLKGKTIVVGGKSLANIAYSYIAIVLQQAGVDPKDVNFVVSSDDQVKLFLDGKNEAIFAATTAAASLRANPANKGKMIHSQTMDQPWGSTNCCFIVASEAWYRANPIAAKRAMRAIYRAADGLGADRADVAKAATDKGLFGGPSAAPLVREASNMVPLDWRAYDPEKAVRFFAPLLTQVGVLKATTDDLVKALDLKIWKELSTELKK